MIINCLIVDDEPLALELLESYVKRTPFLSLVEKCSAGTQVLEEIRRTKIDLIFMDIQMPDLNGLELSKLITNSLIIFTTAFEQYAIEGYKVDAIDYLLKPFGYPDFLRAANKAAKRLSEKAATSERQIPKNLIVKSGYKQIIIDTSEITYIESIDDYIKIHGNFTGNENGYIQTLMNMKDMEATLPSERFIRVHRSFIVNMDKISTIERSRIVFNKEYIPISDSYKEVFEKRFRSKIIG